MKRLCLLLLVFLLPCCVEKEPEFSKECSKEGNSSVKNVTLTLPVVGTGADTVSLYWSKGDTVGVFDGEKVRPFVTSGSGKTALFKGEAADASFYYAVYPYREDFTGPESVSIPEFQRVKAGTPKADVLTLTGGFRPQTPKCTLEMQCALLKVTLPSGVSTVLIKGNGEEAVSGARSDGETFCTLRIAPTAGTSFPAGTFYAQVRPGSFPSGMRCVRTRSTGTSADCSSLETAVTLSAGTIVSAEDVAGSTYTNYLFPSRDYTVDLASVSLKLNKTSGVYAKGEMIELKASSTSAQKVMMRMLDGGLLSYYDVLDLGPQAKVVYKASFDECKSLGFVALYPGQKYFAGVGALVAPEEFTPGYEEPSDFLSWWDAQKKALRASEPVVTLTPVTVGSAYAASYDCWSLEISMPEGNPVRGYMAMPKNAAKGSLPIYMLLHGAGVNGSSNKASISSAVNFAKTGGGCIGLDINAHGMLNDQDQSYYDDLNSGELKGYSTRALTTRDDFYFRLMYLRELRALDYLCSREEWDGKRVMVYGSSQGGGQAAALCGLDSRVGAAVICVPALTDLGGPLQGRQCGWPSAYQNSSATDLGKSILPYFDGALMLQHTDAKLWMLAGHIDETCHPACVWAAYNASSSKDKKITTLPYRRHSLQGPTDAVKYYNSTIAPDMNSFVSDYLK